MGAVFFVNSVFENKHTGGIKLLGSPFAGQFGKVVGVPPSSCEYRTVAFAIFAPFAIVLASRRNSMVA